MSRKILRKRDAELSNYTCSKCGGLLDYVESPAGSQGVYICLSCGWKEYNEDKEEDWTPEMYDMYDGDIPPDGCMACGGPYPDCIASCNMFDD